MVLDAELLKRNLEEIPEEENMIPEESRKLRTLLLVLAGDQRTIRPMSLEDLGELFSESASILSCYRDELENRFDERKLENFRNAGRRAV